MQRTKGFLAQLGPFGSLVLVLVTLLFQLPLSHATDGRDFAGFYEVSNVTDLGDTVRLTLAVRVTNYSDADVANATVTLQDSVNLAQDYGAYAGTVSIANRENARLSAEFTIPHEEYDRWQEGRTPSLRIDYRDADDNARRRPIEMAPGPVGEE